jgi:hypothetical protein
MNKNNKNRNKRQTRTNGKAQKFVCSSIPITEIYKEKERITKGLFH